MSTKTIEYGKLYTLLHQEKEFEPSSLWKLFHKSDSRYYFESSQYPGKYLILTDFNLSYVEEI